MCCILHPVLLVPRRDLAAEVQEGGVVRAEDLLSIIILIFHKTKQLNK